MVRLDFSKNLILKKSADDKKECKTTQEAIVKSLVYMVGRCDYLTPNHLNLILQAAA